MDQVLCYIPDINYKRLIPHFNKRWNEKYLFLMHSIVYQQLRNAKDFNGYVNLDSSLLKKYLGDHYYKFVLNQLISSNIIQPFINSKGINSYSPGSFSRAYRINPLMFENTRIKAVPITKKTYIRKIMYVRNTQLKEAFKLNPNLMHEFIMLTSRRIHVERAVEFVEKNYVKNSFEYNARMLSIREFNAMHKVHKNNSFENASWNEHFEDQLKKHILKTEGKERELKEHEKSKFIPFHFSYNKGRVYSPASNLPRDLEQFTYFTGYEEEKSLCLDLPNSQLCFYEELLQNTVQVKDSKENEEEKMHHIGRRDNEGGYEEEKMLEKQKFLSSSPPPIPPSLCGANFSTQNTWKDNIHKGLGYEIMMKLHKWKDKDTGHTKEERQEFKAIFFGQLFYNRFIPNYLTPLEQTFNLHFPVEAKQLRNIKKRLGNRLLAVQVQTLEGKFFHDICVYYLKTNFDNIPFSIKHDSITFPVRFKALLLPKLNNLVNKFFNDLEFNFKAELL